MMGYRFRNLLKSGTTYYDNVKDKKILFGYLLISNIFFLYFVEQ